MVRICDGRMSGTAYGTVCCTCARGRRRRTARPRPDRRHVILDVDARRLDVEISAEELAARPPAAAAVARSRPRAAAGSGCTCETVQQANTGADLDFLVGSCGDQVSRESH